jgi:hypothetical protein
LESVFPGLKPTLILMAYAGVETPASLWLEDMEELAGEDSVVGFQEQIRGIRCLS